MIQKEPQKNILLLIIQATRSSLISQSDSIRTEANHFLVELIQQLLLSHLLSPNQVHFLVDFFIQKMSDTPSIAIEAINALTQLSTSPAFQPNHVINSCQALFDKIKPRDLDQPKRLMILKLIDHLMAHHPNTLKNMATSFISGYCKIVEGEKDPRNLIVAFKLAKVILTEYKLDDQVQNLFDITFCYFPITFRPPPGNPDAYGGITSEELIQGLIDCLAATPHFGPLVLPLLLEKFMAPGLPPKIQVLRTVVSAFPIYGQSIVAEFASLFWESFLIEIFQPNNTTSSQEFQGLLKRACQTLFSTIFPKNAHFSPSGPIEFMEQAIQVITKELDSPEKSRAIPATRVLCWIIESGAHTIDVILPTMLTSLNTLIHLWNKFTLTSSNNHHQPTHQEQDSDKLKKQTSILAHLSTLFASISAVSSHLSHSGDSWLSSTLQNQILSILLGQVTPDHVTLDPNTQLAALWTLVQFVTIPNSLDIDQARNVIQTEWTAFCPSRCRSTS